MKKLFASFLSRIYHMGLTLSQSTYWMMPYRIKKARARVISIGNITWGGTGKTPLTAKLAHDLKEYGKKVAVLTRGYGKDEVAELEKKLPGVPVVVGRDRVKTAEKAVNDHKAEVLILDDGFQHIRLARDLDIVTINSASPFGPGGLIPQGTLREPLSHLSRAHMFILTKSNIGSKNLHWIRQQLTAVNSKAPIFEAIHKPMGFFDPLANRTIPVGDIRGRRLATLSAIGDPVSFEKTVENLGAEIAYAARYEDHHPYTVDEMKSFIERCRSLSIREAVTTEKDFFRLEPLLQNPSMRDFSFLVLQIEFQIHDEEDFLRRCLNS